MAKFTQSQIKAAKEKAAKSQRKPYSFDTSDFIFSIENGCPVATKKADGAKIKINFWDEICDDADIFNGYFNPINETRNVWISDKETTQRIVSIYSGKKQILSICQGV